MNSSYQGRRFRSFSLQIQRFMCLSGLLGLITLVQSADAQLDHLFWSTPPPIVQAGQPFSMGLQARSWGGELATNFNGTVALSGATVEGVSKLIITEVETWNTQRVELSNLSTQTQDISGCRIIFYDSSIWPVPRAEFEVPPGTICPPGGVFEVAGIGTYPGSYPRFSIGCILNWGGFPTTSPVAVLVISEQGDVMDLFCAGNAPPALIAIPRPVPNDMWIGPTVAPNSDRQLTYQRTGWTDHGNSADWTVANNSFLVRNPSLQTPYLGKVRQLGVAPAAITFTNGVWTGTVEMNVGAHQVVLHADDGTGHSGDSSPFDVEGLPLLHLDVPHAAFKAAPGVFGVGSVSISAPVSSPITVVLTSSLPEQVTLPTSVVIPTGQTNVGFGLTNFDNGLIEGPRIATITATASGYAAASDVVTNFDRLSVPFSVTVPNQAFEGTPSSFSGQIRFSQQVPANVKVLLSSSSTNRLWVPEFIVMGAGRTNSSFSINLINDLLLNGDEAVVVRATVPGWPESQASMMVRDDEGVRTTVRVPAKIAEGSGILTNVGLVGVQAVFPSNLTANLVSDRPELLQVPSTVVILAGQTSAVFTVVAPDNSNSDGDQSVEVAASIEGFISSTRNVTIIDDEVTSFSFETLPAAQIAGQPFPVILSALNSSGTVVSNYSGMLDLSADSSAGNLVVSPVSLGPFTSGSWTGQVTIGSGSRAVRLHAQDGSGPGGFSTLFDVVASVRLGFPVADLVFDSSRQKILAGVPAWGTNGPNVTVLDPFTLGTSNPIPLGGDPAKLAISDDSSYLYAGLAVTTPGGVERVNLSSQTNDLQFPLHPDYNYVDDMKVRPGNAHTLVVSRMASSGYDGGLVVYDDGVPRPNGVPPVNFVRRYTVEFGDLPDEFYSAKPNGLWINKITPSGAVFVKEIPGFQFGAELVYASGFLYSTLGQIFSTNDYSLTGQIPSVGPVVPNPGQGRIYSLTKNSNVVTFNVFDLITLRTVAKAALPDVGGEPLRLVQFSPTGFAFNTSNNEGHLFDASFLFTNSVADLSVSRTTLPAQPAVGTNILYSITVSNLGPATSYGVALTDQLPDWSTLIGATATQGIVTNLNGMVNWALGDMTNGAVARIDITINPAAAGLAFSKIDLDAFTYDPNPEDNFILDTQTVQFSSTNSTLSLVSLPAADIIYDPATDRIIASVSTGPKPFADSIVSLDPHSGMVGNPIPIGHRPRNLGIERNGRHLYVGIDGDFAVRRYDTVSGTSYPQFSIYSGSLAEDLDVRPGFPQTVAVSRHNPFWGGFVKTALYDDGVPRSQTVVSPYIEFSADGSLLYGYGNGDSFFVNQVRSTGLVTTNQWVPANGFSVGVDVAGDQAYYGNGMVQDLASLPTLTQRFNVTGWGPLICADRSTNWVFIIVNHGTNWTLDQFDQASNQLVGSVELSNLLGNPTRLIPWGADGLAIRTDSNQVFLVRVPLIPIITPPQPPPPPPVLLAGQTVFPAVGVLGSNLTYSIAVTNVGPSNAENVVLSDLLPRGASFVSGTTSQGVIASDPGGVTVSLGSLSNAAVATVTLEIAPGLAGLNQNHTTVTASQLNATNSVTNAVTYCWVTFGSALQSADEISLPVADITFDPLIQKLYASVIDTGGPWSNSIVRIDPVTAQIESSIPIPTSPGLLALSDNGKFLYVAENSVGGIARVDLISSQVDTRFPLGVGPDQPIGGSWMLEDMAVMPGSPGTIAVARRSTYFGHSSGVAIYDNGVKRPSSIDIPPSEGFYRVEFASPATLCATSPRGFQILQVEPQGVTNAPILINDYAEDFAVAEGLLYGFTGRVLDTSSLLPVGSLGLGGVPVPDLENGRVYLLTTYGNGPWDRSIGLRSMSSSTFEQYWTKSFAGPMGHGIRLLNLGTNGLAFSTDDNRVFLVRPSFYTPPTAELAIRQTTATKTVTVGGTAAYSYSIANNGPWTATGITISNQIPAGTSYVSATSSQGTYNIVNGALICNLGTLVTGASANFSINLRADSIGAITNQAALSLSQIDPILTNNVSTAVTSVTGQPSVIIGDATANQGANRTSISFLVLLSNPSSVPVSIGYQTLDGTAIAGLDYISTNGTLVIQPGLNNQQLSLSIVLPSQSTVPKAEFFIKLTSATNATITRNQAVGTIIKQVFRRVSVDQTTIVEGNSGLTNASFNLTLSSPSPVPVSVRYRTANGTASAGADYPARSGLVIFAAGATNQVLSVPIFGDTNEEPDEAFFIVLSEPVGAALGANETIATIIDDDAVGPVVISHLELNGNGVSIAFDSVQGRFYRVERADDLATPAWEVVSDQIPGNGANISILDSTAVTSTSRFYRLLLLP